MAPNASDISRRLSGCENEDGEYEAPAGFGFCFRFNPLDGSVTIESHRDHHYTEIHSNCYAPAGLSDVRLLHGGGSGTAVFHGYSPQMGSMVMKHGGAKDTREVFSLARTSRELLERSRLSVDAANFMRQRIPGFVMVYLSPFHMRDRGHELWMSLRGALWAHHGANAFLHASPRHSAIDRSVFKLSTRSIESMDPVDKAAVGHGMRKIRIRKAESPNVEMNVCLKSVVLDIPQDLFKDGSMISDGITFLAELEDELVFCQEEEHWKVTLAQKTIGGPFSQNGADLLTKRKLNDKSLKGLVDEFVAVMKNLRALTLPEERGSLDDILKEVESLRQSKDVKAVSKKMDLFVGSAIIKNFHPTKGRLAKMREYGEQFRSNKLCLVDSEKMPADFLGKLLKPGAPLTAVFSDPMKAKVNAIDRIEHSWLSLLEHATSLRTECATECIWTCGLTDAGLHNTFYSPDRGLELFDLGLAKSTPQPAFLTKFLMSFFHTAGMQSDGKTGWVRRFEVHWGRLTLTQETKDLIPYLENAFQLATDTLVDTLFAGDEGVRQLLVKYVILQLLSDGAFCLDRWEQKGGGHVRNSESSRHLDSWLWRTLWDLYIASHVYSVFLKH